jgi:hypothetical protein
MQLIRERRLRDDLVDRARLLADEYDELAVGAVLRSFFRAVHVARATGVPLEEVGDVAERRTRKALAGRTVPAQWRP